MIVKKILKFILPIFVIRFLKNFLINIQKNKFKKMKNEKIFAEIYNKKIWSPEKEKKVHRFYSGIGSHHDEFIETYLEKMKEFLNSFSLKPSVVDLGCGDFSIGSRLREHCGDYIAVDIFNELIEQNKKKFSSLNVDFRVLDITRDALPSSDICFVRQVLQHLSNDLIKNFITLIEGKYKYLILTEHLPDNKIFKPNIDIVTGPFIRLDKKSGVDLLANPFNLKVIEVKDVCNIRPKKIKGFEGVVNTKILKLN